MRARKRLLPFAVLAAGGLVAAYLAARSPRDQHVRLVLGARADRVTSLEVQYLEGDGEVARDVRMAFPVGQAPRVVSHEPKLADGDYRVRVEVETLEGRRMFESRVTLGGRTTQVDLTGALAAPRTSASSASFGPFPSFPPVPAPSSSAPRTAP